MVFDGYIIRSYPMFTNMACVNQLKSASIPVVFCVLSLISEGFIWFHGEIPFFLVSYGFYVLNPTFFLGEIP